MSDANNQDDTLIAMFVEESQDALADIDAMLVQLEGDASFEHLDDVLRVFHTIKGNSRYVELKRVEEICYELESLVDSLRSSPPNRQDIVDCLLLGVDTLRGICNRLQADESEVTDDASFASILDRLRAAVTAASCTDADLWSRTEHCMSALRASADKHQQGTLTELAALLRQLRGSDVASDAPTDASPTAASSDESVLRVEAAEVGHAPVRTMRVAELKIDEFLGFVGELIVTREMFLHVARELAYNADPRTVQKGLREAVHAFTVLSRDLQQSVMEIRKVPVDLVLRKVPRIVREIALTEGKSIAVHMKKTDIELDKSLVQALEGPLTHLVRNACDHGIETPDRRRAQGKPDKGVITASVTETVDSVTISIQDDGAGVDTQWLLDKAIAAGVISARQAKTMSHEEALDLIFVAGLSTTTQVTDYSGRGVGMSVVKQNIREVGGRLKATSVRDQGTTITITVPKAVSVQILNGFIVRSGAQTFVLPLDSIGESFELDLSDIHHIHHASGRALVRGDRVIPYVDLHDLLKLPAVPSDGTRLVAVTVETPRATYSLGVQAVVGIQQVVVRNIEGIGAENESFACAGAAILGDGNVVLVLSPDAIVGAAAA